MRLFFWMYMRAPLLQVDYSFRYRLIPARSGGRCFTWSWSGVHYADKSKNGFSVFSKRIDHLKKYTENSQAVSCSQFFVKKSIVSEDWATAFIFISVLYYVLKKCKKNRYTIGYYCHLTDNDCRRFFFNDLNLSNLKIINWIYVFVCWSWFRLDSTFNYVRSRIM